jgi:glutaredoxin
MKMSSTLAGAAPLGLALLLCAAGAHAQMYKWTDAKGVVHFSDQPPPGDAKVETRRVAGGAPQADLPYALAEAARANPVVLYTTPDCAACDEGRALLKQRGIPFAERTVKSNDDQQVLKQAGSDGQLPLLLVGSSKRVGFEPGAWNEALTGAAYPKQNILPGNYRYAGAAPASPVRAVVRPEPDAAAKRKAPPPPPPDDAPPGFRF